VTKTYERTIYDYVKKHPGLSGAAISKGTGWKLWGLWKALERLEQKGCISNRGAKRGSAYYADGKAPEDLRGAHPNSLANLRRSWEALRQIKAQREVSAKVQASPLAQALAWEPERLVVTGKAKSVSNVGGPVRPEKAAA
jgi:hypothetical protein